MGVRWPLALRFVKGAVHVRIIGPVLFHALFAALIVGVDMYIDGHLGLPASIVCGFAPWLSFSTYPYLYLHQISRQIC